MNVRRTVGARVRRLARSIPGIGVLAGTWVATDLDLATRDPDDSPHPLDEDRWRRDAERDHFHGPLF